MHDSEELARESLVASAPGFLVKTDAKRHLIAAVQAVAEHKPFFRVQGVRPASERVFYIRSAYDPGVRFARNV